MAKKIKQPKIILLKVGDKILVKDGIFPEYTLTCIRINAYSKYINPKGDGYIWASRGGLVDIEVKFYRKVLEDGFCELVPRPKRGEGKFQTATYRLITTKNKII